MLLLVRPAGGFTRFAGGTIASAASAALGLLTMDRPPFWRIATAHSAGFVSFALRAVSGNRQPLSYEHFLAVFWRTDAVAKIESPKETTSSSIHRTFS